MQNSERLREVSSEMRYLQNNILEKESLELTLGAWVTALVMGISLSLSGDSRITSRPPSYAVIFSLLEDTFTVGDG